MYLSKRQTNFKSIKKQKIKTIIMEKNIKQEIVSYLTKTSEHTFIKLGWAVSCSHRSGICNTINKQAL